tara:strand:- start:497 stop:976 length:480 start_codon:yes stop_codon:yes gene_type:complete
MRSDALNSSSNKYGLNQIRQIVKSQDADDTIELAADQSGALVLLRNCGAAKLINLPDASGNDGVWYDFYLHETLSAHTTTIQSKDGTDFFFGTVADGETATPAEVAFNGSSHDQLVVGASTAAGEFECRLVCDGDNWLIMHGISQDIGDISAGTSSSNT